MECFLEMRVYRLLPWVEKRRQRAMKGSDTKSAFSAVALMDRLRLIEINADPVASREQALLRNQRLLHSN